MNIYKQDGGQTLDEIWRAHEIEDEEEKIVVKKPQSKDGFFQVSSDPDYSISCLMLKLEATDEDKANKEFNDKYYLVDRSVVEELKEINHQYEKKFKPYSLMLAVDQDGRNMIYIIPITKQSAHLHEITEEAKHRWAGISEWEPNESQVAIYPTNMSRVPAFRQDPFPDLVELGFGDRLVESIEHEVIQLRILGNDSGKPVVSPNHIHSVPDLVSDSVPANEEVQPEPTEEDERDDILNRIHQRKQKA